MKSEIKKHAAALAIIILAGFVVYWPSVNGQFVWDDLTLIVDNPQIKQPGNIGVIFRENIGAYNQEMHSTYRPLQMLTHMIDYQLWQLKPTGYHLFNIALHVTTAVLFYFLLLLLFSEPLLSFGAAILFVVHPVHNEAVAYISGRADPLMGVFFMLTFIAYLKSAQTKGWGWLLPMAFFFVLALLAKEYALIIPLLAAVYHLTLKKKWAIRELVCLSVLAGVFIILRVTETIGLMRLHASDETSLGARVPGCFAALADYLRLLVVPFRLHMEYGRDLFLWNHPMVIVGVVLAALMVFKIFKWSSAAPIVSFSLLWFMVALLPVANLVPVNAFMAEHWLYIPSMGMFLLASWGLMRLSGAKGMAWPASLLAVLMLFYGALSFRQSAVWVDPITFYQYTIPYAPTSSRIQNNLGTIYLNQGEYAKAKEHIEKAIELNPKYASAYNNLGMIYSYIGPKEKVSPMYEKAIALEPNHIDAINNLAVEYAMDNKFDKSLELFNRILAINPDVVDVQMNLCVIYNKLGRKSEAIRACEHAIKLDPLLTLAYNNIAVALNETGKRQEAISMYEQSLRIDPKDYFVLNNLGTIYYELGQKEKAAWYYQEALKINPGYKEASANLAILSALNN